MPNIYTDYAHVTDIAFIQIFVVILSINWQNQFFGLILDQTITRNRIQQGGSATEIGNSEEAAEIKTRVIAEISKYVYLWNTESLVWINIATN